MNFLNFMSLMLIVLVKYTKSQCLPYQSEVFVRWPSISPEGASPVFVYSASGEEESLTGSCLARCKELVDCVAVAVAYTGGNCYGVATTKKPHFQTNLDIVYFKKTCLKLPSSCSNRWWALESTLGYYFNSDAMPKKVIQNATVQQCYESMLSVDGNYYRSAQWFVTNNSIEVSPIPGNMIGVCTLNTESRITEPESFRVSNYNTVYIENQCGHDYQKRIDRCSYEEYNNQTLKHVDFTYNNFTKDECKSACELENRFVCRGFSWTAVTTRGHCDLHSEDLVSTGSWLTRRLPTATYYRRVICLNFSVECSHSDMTVTYHPRGMFRGRIYVPGRGEKCSASLPKPDVGPVRLVLPLYGDCDVNFAFAISKGPNGVLNRTLAYVMLMIQNNPIIQSAGDRWVRAGCSPGSGAHPFTKVDATVAVHESGRPSAWASTSDSPAASAVLGAGPSPLSMYVVRTHAGVGADAVPLGEPLELRIDTAEQAEIEAYQLVASSRLGDSSVLLLDNRGCPTGQVDFPALTRTYIGNIQRLSARFKAFRFPTSQIVRFSLMVRFCGEQCTSTKCDSKPYRNYRDANNTQAWNDDGVIAKVTQEAGRAAGWECAGRRAPLELELVVSSRDMLSADTLVRADHRAAPGGSEEVWRASAESGMVCVHEVVVVALALVWLAVQVLLLMGCCVLVRRYRKLAEMNIQKEYQSFDNIGFDTVSTHRRVHWPDQNIDMIHT